MGRASDLSRDKIKSAADTDGDFAIQPGQVFIDPIILLRKAVSNEEDIWGEIINFRESFF